MSESEPTGFIAGAVRRPVTVGVLAVLVSVFGLSAVVGLPIQLSPDIARPVIEIETTWPGAAPTEIESEILQEQEDVLKAVPNMLEMTSTARPDRGTVSLEFEVGTNLDAMLVRVSQALQRVPRYPENARLPVVTTADSSGPALAVLAIRALDGSPVAAFRSWVQQEIIPEFERIPGVAGVRFVGGRATELQVDYDPAALASRGMRVGELVQRMRAELRDVSGGEVELGRRRFLVRTALEPVRAEDLENVVLRSNPDGSVTRVGDVARVRFSLRRTGGSAFTDDKPSMVILLNREAGTNVLEVTEAIRAAAERLDVERFRGEGLTLEVISDQTEYIHNALDLVRENLLSGAFFAILSLFIFLGNWRSAALINLSIPICVLATATSMYLFGRSLNVVSLAGITFAVGMVVDNSTVVLENIETWRTRVATSSLAAIRGTQEVWAPVLASTGTTVAVFLPFIAWEGEVAQLLLDVAIAVVISISLSFVVAVVVIPPLAARMPAPADREPNALERVGDRFRAVIARVSGKIAASRLGSLGVVALAIGVSAYGLVSLAPPLEYLPTGNRNLVFGFMIAPPGTSATDMEALGRRMQASHQSHLGRETDGVPALQRTFFIADGPQVIAGAVAQRSTDIPGVLAYMRRVQSGVPGYIAFTNQASLFGSAAGQGRTVELRISGADYDQIMRTGTRLFAAARAAFPGAQVRPVPSLDAGAPELRFLPRRTEIARVGLRGDEVALALDSLADGALIGEYTPEGRNKLDVIVTGVRADGTFFRNTADLLSAPIATAAGPVPLGTVLEARETITPSVIQRIERRRVLSIQVSPPEDLPLELAIERLERDVVAVAERDGTIGRGVTVRVAGVAGKLVDAKRHIGNILLAATLICFLLLAALFEDLVAPFAVLLTIPLAGVGGMFTLRLVDLTLAPIPLDMMTAMGFLILVGTSVNNAVLLVDGAMARLAEGADLLEALETGVRSRVRPIFMTTITTLVGLVPMVVAPGEGSELYRGVGTVVLGGIAVSTLVTLFVTPAFYGLLIQLQRAIGRLVRRA